MKHFLLALALVCAGLILTPKACQAYNDATQLRAAAALTTADVLSTTMTQSAGKPASVLLYVDLTNMGGLSAVTVAKAHPRINTNASDYYADVKTSSTFSIAGKYLLMFPKESFPTGEPFGFVARGTGTASGSSLALHAKIEQ